MSACAPTWMRCRSPSSRASRMRAASPACTTAAATTATLRCCSARRASWHARAASTARCTSSSSPPKKARGGARVMVEAGPVRALPVRRGLRAAQLARPAARPRADAPGPDHGRGRPLRHRAARPRRPCGAAAPHARRAAGREPACGAAQHHRRAPHRSGRIGGAVGHARCTAAPATTCCRPKPRSPAPCAASTPRSQDRIEAALRDAAAGIALAHGVGCRSDVPRATTRRP